MGIAEKAKTAVAERRTLEAMIARYLKPEAGWTAANIGIALMLFEDTHGTDAIAAMGRFIEWAERNGRLDIIAVTLGHDLNGCENPLMSPRTSGY